jgi:peptidoglycan/LPS O-acetylase OafA/YrhL
MSITIRADTIPSPSETHPPYRPDIDGLRAIAVLSVIGFHGFPSWIKGGFVGVDIFFVISGFLISSIIIKGLDKQRFSYLDFYARRIKRIFPALIVVLAGCLAFGWFALFANEYESLGRHILGGAAFVSNLVLWREAGYFDVAAEFKPLLHLWSLGIEEQFYIIWPLLLAFFWRKTHRLLLVIVVLLLLSLFFNLFLIDRRPTATFYLPFTRFWELMMGSLLAYAGIFAKPREWLANVLRVDARLRQELLAWTGLLLLTAAIFLTNKDLPFPGALALVPTLGALCLIAAGPGATPNNYALACRPLVFIGTISYPLYLWHWPLLSFARIVEYGAPSPAERILLIVAGYLLAWLTYRFVENPIRTGKSQKSAILLFFVSVVLAATGLAISASRGLEFRAVNDTQTFKLLAASKTLNKQIRAKYRTASCDRISMSALARAICSSFGDAGADTIVIWGDSHADAWAPVFYDIASEKKLRVVLFAGVGCPPLIGIRRTDAQGITSSCADQRVGQDVVDAIRALKPKHIFLISRWGLYADGWRVQGELQRATHFITTHPNATADIDSSRAALRSQLGETLKALTEYAPVTIFRSTPTLKVDIENGLLRGIPLELPRADYLRSESRPNEAIDAARAQTTGIEVFDPSTLICRETCKVVLDEQVMYSDDNHITAQGALLFKDVLVRSYFAFLPRPPEFENSLE